MPKWHILGAIFCYPALERCSAQQSQSVYTHKKQQKVGKKYIDITVLVRLYTWRNKKGDLCLFVCLEDKWKWSPRGSPALQRNNALPTTWFKLLVNSMWLAYGKCSILWKPQSHRDKWLKQKRKFQMPCLNDLLAFIIRPQTKGKNKNSWRQTPH